MIMAGAVLVVNSAIKPKDGSIITASIDVEFRLVRFRNVPTLHLEGLDTPPEGRSHTPMLNLQRLGTIFALVWLRMS